jgi:hypothetical protein
VVRDEDAAADGDIRVIDESGEDYLYPATDFVVIDVPAKHRVSLLPATKREFDDDTQWEITRPASAGAL